MIEVYNKQRQLIGILQNAHNIIENEKINAISTFSFALPHTDPKNELCAEFNYIRYNDGELYRILPKMSTIDAAGFIQYTCEHVLALLLDSVLFGQHVIGNIGVHTRTVLEWILDKQNKRYDPWARVWTVDPTKKINWQLGECDFTRQFEYCWEQETLLRAIFSVPAPFVDKYMWTFNTKSHPFILNLKRIDENINPQMYIRARKNQIRLSVQSDPTSLCTRIYPLGEGEGINQLTIHSVNSGIPYIQSPPDIVSKYGLIERIWIDRRYINDQSLKEAAAAMLAELQQPYEEYQVEFALLGKDQFDQPAIGKVVEIIGHKKTYITGIDWIHSDISASVLHIANQPRDIATSIANLADRQRIEMAYAQGATTFFERDAQGNADPSIPLTMKFLIPTDLRIINFVRLDVECGAFRKPFKVTQGGGGFTTAPTGDAEIFYSGNITFSGDSGAYWGNTGDGGGGSTGDGGGGSTGSGGGGDTGSGGSGDTGDGGSGNTGSATVQVAAQTMSDIAVGGTSTTTMWQGVAPSATSGEFAIGGAIQGSPPAHIHSFNPMHFHYSSFTIPGQSLSHSHSSNAHSHSVSSHTHSQTAHSHTQSAHTHTVSGHNHSIPSHSHSVGHSHSINHSHNLPAHTHQIPDHVHTLAPGVEYSGNPTSFRLFINGVQRLLHNGKTLNRDIAEFLVDSDNKIPRNSYYRIEILPNDAAHILMTVSVQGFVQSRGDATM